MDAIPMIAEAAIKTMVRNDMNNPPSRMVEGVRPLCTSNIAYQHRLVGPPHPCCNSISLTVNCFNLGRVASCG
jgi:hypothetical protein